MKQREHTGAMRPVALVVVLLIAVVAVVLFVAIRKPQDDRLFHDTMADVHSAGAMRIDRDVQHPGKTLGKPQTAEVIQIFRASAAGAPAVAVRGDLIRQANLPDGPSARRSLVSSRSSRR